MWVCSGLEFSTVKHTLANCMSSCLAMGGGEMAIGGKWENEGQTGILQINFEF